MSNFGLPLAAGELPSKYEWMHLASESGSEIERQLQQAGQQLRDLEVRRQAIYRTIGGLLQQAQQVGKAVQDNRSRPDMATAAVYTGLSRPTLYDLRDRYGAAEDPTAPEQGGPAAGLSNRELARRHAQGGYGHEEPTSIDAEFWTRFPDLKSWWYTLHTLKVSAAKLAEHAYLETVPEQEREQVRSERLLWLKMEPAPPYPALDDMHRRYRVTVDMIASHTQWPWQDRDWNTELIV